MWRRVLAILCLGVLVVVIILFAPPPAWEALPVGYSGRTAGWVSVEWSMQPHTPDEIAHHFFARTSR